MIRAAGASCLLAHRRGALARSVVPLLNLAVPASSPLHLSAYALTLDRQVPVLRDAGDRRRPVWGYCGILSLGHAAFFSLGGYAMGMYLMRQIGPRGVYGDPVLPDFMVFLNWKELPWFWYGFNHFWFALAHDRARAGAARVGVRLACVPLARHGRLPFDHHAGADLRADARVLPQRHGLRRQQRIYRFQGHPRFRSAARHARASVLLVASAAALAASYWVCRAIVESRAGRVMRAIRDAESRTRFLGYPRRVLQAVGLRRSPRSIAGVAGALYVPQVGIINPGEFAPINSIEAVIWVAVGGRGTLFGAAAGAVLVNYAKTYFTGALPEVWLYALGALFVLVTLFLPRGTRRACCRPEKRK